MKKKIPNILWLSMNIIVLVTLLSMTQCQSDKKSDAKDRSDSPILNVSSNSGGTVAVIKTNKGTIQVELATQDAPKTSANFIALAKRGFYDGLTFHRVVPNFVVQGGDPKGDGTGGAKKEITLEILCNDGRMILGRTAPKDCTPKLQHLKGAIAMARSQSPNSASSQFYITLKDVNFLDRNYAVFGYVIEGQSVVDKIRKGDTMKSITLKKTK